MTYIHAFRALAILFIVTGHAIDAFVWSENCDLERCLRILFCNGSSLFVFIAGYLFHYLSPKFEAKKYYITKLWNVIIPYVVISVPAIVLFTAFLHRATVWDGFYQAPVWKQVLTFYLTGDHLAPLWFVPMISIFYACAPLFVKLDRNRILYYLLPVFIVLSLFVSRGSAVQSFVHFLSVYVLGMACSRFREQIGPVIGRLRFLVPVFLVCLVAALVECHRNVGTMTNWNYVQKLFASLFFLGLLSRWNDRLRWKAVGTIAETSFGVFFLHAYVLTAWKLSYIHFNGQLPAGGAIGMFALAMATFAICVPAILLIKRGTGKYSRYLIGC